MRSVVMLQLFILVSLKVISQQHDHTIDSLRNVLHNHLPKDSTRLNLLLELSDEVPGYDESIALASEAIELARNLNIKNKWGHACRLKASAVLAIGNDTMAMSLLTDALKIFRQINDQSGLALVHTGTGRVFQARGQYFSAIEYYQKSLKIFENLNDNKRIAGLNLDIGACFYLQSNYTGATEYYLKAKTVAEKSGDLGIESMALNNLGMAERDLKKYNSSLEYLRKALTIKSIIKDSSGFAKTLQGIGITYDDMQKSDSALWYYNKAFVINKRNNFKKNIAENLNNLAIIYKDLNRYNESFTSLNEAVTVFRELNDEKDLRNTEINIGDLFCTAPDSFFGKKTIPISQRYIKSGSLYLAIIAYAKKSGQTDLESRAWDGMSEVYKKQGNYKSSLEAYTKYVTLRDSIVNEEKVASTTQQIDKIEFEKKEAATQATHIAEIKQQQTFRNVIAGSAGIVVLGGIIYLSLYKRKRDAVQKQKEAELKTEISETEMKALRAQMNPHFIFNSLNSISDYISKNNTGLAGDYLTKFAKLMRLILENSEQKEVSLSQDLQALELYMQLESLRMNNKFSYEIKTDGSIDKENTLVPPLILQPFVENSIWHGLAQKKGPGKITVYIKKEGDMMNCMVEDNGIGRKEAALVTATAFTTEKKSLGMKITRERIDMLNKVKKCAAGIKFFDLQQGTRVEVILPLELSF